MKRKIISTIALSLLSVTAFAYQGHGYKILNERITSSPGFNFKVIDSSKTAYSSPNYITASASVNDVRGRPNEYIKLEGYHHVNISNSTTQIQRYRFMYDLKCVDAAGSFSRDIEIYPHGTFSDDTMTFATFQPTTEGLFDIYATTQITGAENTRNESKASAYIR